MILARDHEVLVTRAALTERTGQGNVAVERGIAVQSFIEAHEQGVIGGLSAGKAEREAGDGQEGKQPCSGDECCGDTFHFVVLRFSFLF